jgi:hypothetical protein
MHSRDPVASGDCWPAKPNLFALAIGFRGDQAISHSQQILQSVSVIQVVLSEFRTSPVPIASNWSCSSGA